MTRHGICGAALALACACGGGPTPGSATDSESQGQSTSTGVTSFPTTSGDPTGATDSQGATDSLTSGVSATGTGTSGDTSGMISATSDSTTTTTSTTGDTTTTTTTTTDPGSSGTTQDSTDSTAGSTDTGGSSTGSSSTTGGDECGTVLKATIRDFKFEHPDFEDYGGNAAYKGIVEADLGPDQKPVYAHPGPTPQTSGPDAFKQWYNDTPGVNMSFAVDLPLVEVMPGLYQYANNNFFPVDNQGFGNEGQNHNFAFTTEIHTSFTYNGGEVFTFTGDDDVWIFLNGKLAIDLGGLHPQLSDTLDLDASAAMLGITPGNTYPMDIFHAERHTTESNFRIDTTIGCFVPQ